MYSQNTVFNNLDFYFVLAAILFGVGTLFWRRFSIGQLLSRTPPAPDAVEGAAILAYYTAGHSLFNVKRGNLDGMKYSFMITGPGGRSTVRDNGYVDESAVIYTLDLPFNTETHLVGLSKKFKIDRVQFEAFLLANSLVKITLEGDFPDYFDLYAKKDQDFQVRYVLDPEAMAFVVDYSRSHFWEINDAELYFVNPDPNQDSTDILKESQRFVEQIKPALLPGDPNAPTVHHEVPYGEYDGPPLPCPRCKKTMTLTDTWQVCPDGQGILINGRNLKRLNNHELRIQLPAISKTQHSRIICPNCHNPMVSVAFDGSKDLRIDSCEHCPFRWLDADDISQLTAKKT